MLFHVTEKFEERNSEEKFYQLIKLKINIWLHFVWNSL